VTNTESEQQVEMDIDAQADLLEVEMGEEIDASKDEGYLLPWLIPVGVIAAFVVIVVLMLI
jgi:hypothetical protein